MNDFFTLDLLIKTVAAAVASLAFSVVIKVNKKHLPHATVLSALTYLVYYTVLYFDGTVFLAAFLSTALAALLSEILARVRSAPTIVFLLPSVIPTVPGGGLYYSMRDLLREDMVSATENLMVTLKIGLGIAGGIVSVSIIFGILSDAIRKHKLKK